MKQISPSSRMMSCNMPIMALTFRRGESRRVLRDGRVYAEVCQVVAKGGITSIADLRGKRVSVGDVGSGVEFNARQILEAYGMTFDDIIVNNLSFGDSAAAFKDGKIDAFFCVAGAPTTAIVELATTNPINLLTIDDEHADKLMEKYPFTPNIIFQLGLTRALRLMSRPWPLSPLTLWPTNSVKTWCTR